MRPLKPLSLLVTVALTSGCDREAPPGAPPSGPGAAVATVTGQPGAPRLPAELLPAPSASAAPAASAVPEPEPAPWAGPFFAVTAVAAAVYSAPGFVKERKIGYVRNGGRVPVNPKPVSKDQCSGGWYEIVGGGYLCGNLGTTDLEHPQVKFALSEPDLDAVLPYTYARNAKNGTPLYKSVPSREQMWTYEPYLPGAKKVAKENGDTPPAAETPPASKVAAVLADEPAAPPRGSSDGGAPVVAAATALGATGDAGLAATTDAAVEKPWWQRDDAKGRLHEVRLEHLQADSDDVLARRMVEGFYVAVDKPFGWNDRRWYKTTKGLVAPADRFWLTEGSKFQGVSVDGAKWQLPIAWVYGGVKTAPAYQIDEEKRTTRPHSRLERFTPIALTGKEITLKGITYSETRDGVWVKNIHVRKTAPMAPPADLGPEERWISVNRKQQTLVAFIGTQPVYATLVSTGKSSTIKEKDHATPLGEWRVREKHVTTTMDGDGSAAGDLPYSIEDVPYVLYFSGSYALHGAFWHRNFGVQMSHGCVNLAPLDAKHLFFFSDPPVPKGWHGAWSSASRPGSRIVVHE